MISRDEKSMFSYEKMAISEYLGGSGRCFVVFVGGCFVRAKRRRGLSGAKKGANWLLFLKMDVLSSFLRKYSFIYIYMYIYISVYACMNGMFMPIYIDTHAVI